MEAKVTFKEKRFNYEDNFKESIGKTKILRKAFKFLVLLKKISFYYENTLAVNKL